MRVIYSAVPSERDERIIKDISNRCGILYDTARLLFTRNIDTVEKAQAFLHPDKTQFHSPFNFKEMNAAVERVKKAKDNSESVLIFGDYDADGVCATTVLYNCLKEYGVIADTFIPERDEGYGLNIQTIADKNAQNKIDLIITVDCGISDNETIEKIKSMGIDVIVTDHHEPPEVLPSVIKINPKIEDSGYPFNCLCGAGVAYKLGYALIGAQADKYLDIVALATVADSMDLIGENRALVYEGLKLFNNGSVRKQFTALLGDNNGKPITAQTIAYGLAPKINAGGRMGDARSALKLLLAESEEEITKIGELLKNHNANRQVMCDEIYRQAKEKIANENLAYGSVLLVAGDEWQTGFVGIVASKLVEEYSRPVIVFAGHDGKYKGSARSVDGINIFDAISEVKDLVEGYGGHAQAAGVTIEKENLSILRTRLNEVVDGYRERDTERKIFAEWNIESEISLRFAREIDALEPFGAGNRRPSFTIRVKGVNSTPLKIGSPHYTFRTPFIEMLDFNGESRVKTLAYPINKKIVFEFNVSTFRGIESVKGVVKAVLPEVEDKNAFRLYAIDNELKKIVGEEVLVKVLPAMPKDFHTSNDGVIFLISDAENLKHYPQLIHADVHLFDMVSQGSVNVIVSPERIPTWAKTAVYLDVPLKYLPTDKRSVCKFDYTGFNFIEELSVERSVFKEYFNKIVANAGKEYKNAVDFYNSYIKSPIDTEAQAIQFLFCFEVFSELGFFYVSGGVLRRDARAQSPLDGSQIYKRISDLKG